MTADRMYRRAPSPIPAWKTAGLRRLSLGPGWAVHQMEVPDSLLDRDGVPAAGGLAILADSAIGYAVVSTVDPGWGMVTSHLHLAILRPLPHGPVTLDARGEQRGIDGGYGVGAGDIATADGVALAQATIGTILLDPRTVRSSERRDPRQPVDAAAEVPADRTHALIDGAPVHHLLGTRVVDSTAGVRVLMRTRPELANSSGGLHGGFGFLMAERTLDLALRAAIIDERRLRPVELRAAFLRPIAADVGDVECRAAVLHLGRRLAAVRGEVRDAAGRPAVLVDATYVAS